MSDQLPEDVRKFLEMMAAYRWMQAKELLAKYPQPVAEPAGLGAVVREPDGCVWVHVRSTVIPTARGWVTTDGFADWNQLVQPVMVLSAGVEL